MAGHAQLKFVMTECSKTQIRLTGLKSHLKLKGKFDATIERSSKITPATVFVVEGNYGNLLGYQTLVDPQVIPCINSLIWWSNGKGL